MLDLLTLQSELSVREVTLTIEETNLKINGKSRLTPELIDSIRAHKPALLALLADPVAPTQETFPLDRGIKQYGRAECGPPLICHKCHNTRAEHFKMNLLRNRWVCCNCMALSHLIFLPYNDLPEPANPGPELEQLRREIAEHARQLDEMNRVPSAEETRVILAEIRAEHEQEQVPERHTDNLPVVKLQEPVAAHTQGKGTIHCAVMHNTGFTWVDAGKLVTIDATPTTFEALADIAITYGLRNIWITPGCTLSEYIFDHPGEYLQGDWNSEHTKVTQVSATHKAIVRTREYSKQAYPVMASLNRLTGPWAEKRIVYIHLPQFDNRWADDKVNGWELADVEEPKALLAALTYLHDTFGVDIGAPGHTGVELLKEVNASETRASLLQAADLTMLPDHREVDMQFYRALTAEEMEEAYLYILDRNGMYLGAATGAEIGVGTPEHVSGSDLLAAWDKHTTGVWKVTVTAPKNADTRLMEIVSQFIKTGEQWAYTPAVDTFVALGYAVEFHEAWIWTKTHRTLQPWGKLLWDTRIALHEDRKRFPHEPGAETARNMTKRIATQALFWLDLQSDRKRVPTPPLHRPDIPAMVLSLARYRMVLKILECIKAGYYPVFGYTDGIGFISNDPNPRTAIPGLMLVTDTRGVVHDRSTALGGFKCEHTFTLDSEIKALFSGKLAPYQVKQALNAKARGE